MLNRAQYWSDVIVLVVLWRLRYKLSLRDLLEMFTVRGIVFSHEAVRAWEAQLTPALAAPSTAPARSWTCCSANTAIWRQPRRPSALLRTHAGTSESGLIGGFLGGVFGRHLIGWLTKHASDNGSKQCADNSMNAVCA